MRRVSRIILGLFLLCSCTDFLNTWDGYIIPKGNHYSHRSGMPPRLISFKDGRHLVFEAMFMPNCLYDPVNDDINKLYGFTDCNSSVHENSARFGWRVNKDQKIELFAYWYESGHLGYQSMGFTEPNRMDSYEIWAKQDTYWFSFNGTVFEALRTKDCVHGLRVRLFPYFGGNETAPHEMQIEILEKS